MNLNPERFDGKSLAKVFEAYAIEDRWDKIFYIDEDGNAEWEKIHKSCMTIGESVLFDFSTDNDTFIKSDWNVAFDGRAVADQCVAMKKDGAEHEFNARLREVCQKANKRFIYDFDMVSPCEVLKHAVQTSQNDKCPTILQSSESFGAVSKKIPLNSSNVNELFALPNNNNGRIRSPRSVRVQSPLPETLNFGNMENAAPKFQEELLAEMRGMRSDVNISSKLGLAGLLFSGAGLVFAGWALYQTSLHETETIDIKTGIQSLTSSVAEVSKQVSAQTKTVMDDTAELKSLVTNLTAAVQVTSENVNKVTQTSREDAEATREYIATTNAAIQDLVEQLKNNNK